MSQNDRGGDPCDVVPSQEGSEPGWGRGATTPRAAGWMGLCKSKLPEMGRALRPQEKGNVAGAAGWLPGGKGRRLQRTVGRCRIPYPVPGMHTRPSHGSNTTAHAHGATIHCSTSEILEHLLGSGPRKVNLSNQLPTEGYSALSRVTVSWGRQTHNMGIYNPGRSRRSTVGSEGSEKRGGFSWALRDT